MVKSKKKISLWWDSNSSPPCYLNWMLALDVIAAESSNMNVIPRNTGLLEKPVINRSSHWFENGAKCEHCWGKWVVNRSLSSWKWILVSEIRLATRTTRLVNHRIRRWFVCDRRTPKNSVTSSEIAWNHRWNVFIICVKNRSYIFFKLKVNMILLHQSNPSMFSMHLVCVWRQRQVVSPIMTLENKMSHTN